MPKKKTSVRGIHKSKQKKNFFLSLPLFISISFIIVCVFYIYPFWQKQVIRNELTKILSDEWQEYTKDKPNFTAGVAMQIFSPKGNYFISSGMGNIDENTHFRTASVSKTFTSAAIMLLHQQGKLNIEDKIVSNIPGKDISYVPETTDYDIPYKNDITIKDLLMHRSGMYDLSNSEVPIPGGDYIGSIKKTDADHTFTFDELVGVNAKYKLSYFAPRADYHYSNTGFSLLGKIIERVSGSSYATFVHDALLRPNGLDNTTVVYNGSDNQLPNPFISGYEWIDGKVEDVTKSNMSPHVAEGSITTTPKNLATWLKKLITGQAGLTKDTIQMMKDACTPMSAAAPDAKYSYGLVCNKGWFGHNGAHIGYLTNTMYNPATDVTFVIFTNSWNSSSRDAFIDELKELNAISEKVLSKLGYH